MRMILCSKVFKKHPILKRAILDIVCYVVYTKGKHFMLAEQIVDFTRTVPS